MVIDTSTALLEVLTEHNLLEPDQFAKIKAAVQEDQNIAPAKLLAKMQEQGWLTPYQAEHVRLGLASELVLGPYCLLDLLGAGGMGQVFKARHRNLGRIVALKVIRQERTTSADAVRRFLREIQTTAQLNHPNIVAALDADQVDQTICLAMEYVEGIDLSRLVMQRGPLAITEACNYIRQAALGLQHAYKRGLIHRDIKPSNLMLTRDGVVKLLDMGLARRAGEGGEELSELTRAGVVMGTPDYMSPEQARDARTADVRSDLYSLGCTFFYLLTGQPPFPKGETPLEKALHHQIDQPPLLNDVRHDVPQGVAAVVHKLLYKRPEQRFQRPAELAKVLEAFCQGDYGVSFSAELRGALASTGAQDPTVIGPPSPLPGPATPVPDDSPPRRSNRISSAHNIIIAPGAAATRAGPRSGVRLGRATSRSPRTRSRMQSMTNRVILATIAAVFASLGLGLVNLWWQFKPTVVTVAANQPWQDTHVDIPDHAIQPIRLRVEGEWQLRPDAPACSVEGLADVARDEAVRADTNVMCLLARIGDTAVAVPVGRETTLPPAAGGRLFVQANALDLSNAQGHLVVTIDGGQFRADAAAAPAPLAVQQHHDAARLAWQPLAARLATLPREQAALRSLRDQLHAFRAQFCGTIQATQAVEVLGRILPLLPSPLDALDAMRIPTTERSPNQPRELVAVLRTHGNLDRRDLPATSVALAPDGKSLAWAGGDRVIHLWDLAANQEIRTWPGHQGDVTGLAYAPDGRTVISASSDQTLKLWKPDQPATANTLSGHKRPITCLAIAADGNSLATGSDSGIVRLWDGVTGEMRSTDAGNHRDRVTGVAFAPNSQTLASVGLDRQIHLADLSVTTQPLPRSGGPSRVGQSRSINMDASASGLAYSPDGRTLATGGRDSDQNVTLWEASSGRRRTVFQGTKDTITAIVYAPDGRTLVSAGESGQVTWWDVATGKPRAAWRLAGPVSSVVFAFDGRHIATANGDGTVYVLRLAEAANGERGRAGAAF